MGNNKSPEEIIVRRARVRARRKGLPCNISRQDIAIPATCPVLGIPIFKAKGVTHPGSPSLDRINNDLGYVRGNVRVISYRANSLKSNATIAEMELVLKDLHAHP